MSQEIERPKTSHGRPRTGYRNRQVNQFQENVPVDPHYGPRSPHGRPVDHHRYEGTSSHLSYGSEQHAHTSPRREYVMIDQQVPHPVYIPLKDDCQNDPPARPKSSRGRSREAQNPSPNFEDTSFARPKSSRGRQMRNDDVSGQAQQYEQSPTRRARPKSAKGRNRSARHRPQPAYHFEADQQPEADVLVIDHPPSSPQYASYGQTSHTPSNEDSHTYSSPAAFSNSGHEYGDFQRAHAESHEAETHHHEWYEHTDPVHTAQTELLADTSHRPMSGRPQSGRSSARPPTAAERKIFNEGIAKDNEILRSGTPLSARPDSASSFSKYNILPSIGLRPKAVKTLTKVENQPQQQPTSYYRQPIKRESNAGGALSPRKALPASPAADPVHQTPIPSPIAKSETPVPTTGGGLMPIKIPLDGVTTDASNDDENTKSKDANNSTSDSKPKKTATADESVTAGPMFPALEREVTLPIEPTSGDDTLLLAIKQPDGKRIQRKFLKTETLRHVINFAEFYSNLDFTGTEIVCDAPGDAPRKVFDDLSIKLCDSGLQDRTVLHIQVPDT